MEEKQRVEAYTVGIKKTSGKVRLVKITTVLSSVADQIIAKGRKLNAVETGEVQEGFHEPLIVHQSKGRSAGSWSRKSNGCQLKIRTKGTTS